MVHIALLSLPLLASCIYATPFAKADSISLLRRADGSSNYTDPEILNYALTLEHLEATFYAQGLTNYSASDFVSAGFTNETRSAIQLLADQEATHVTALTAGLSAAGATPVSACNYTWGVSDVKGFLALSSVLESVGVSAYLGAAPYVTNPAYLTIAAAITTVEARHQAYVAYLNGQSPFPSPFDTAEGLRQIVTLASGFITSCPEGSAPTLQTFPSLTLSGNATAGSYITIKSGANATTNGTLYCAFASGVNPVAYAPYITDNSSCLVPAGDVGQTYVVLTNSNSTLSDNNTVAGPAILALGVGKNFVNIVNSPQATSTNVPSGSGFGGVASASSTGASATKTSKSNGATSNAVSGVSALLVAAMAVFVL